VDLARVFHTKAGLSSAADAAVLAAGRTLGEGGRSDADVEKAAQSYFAANLGDASAFGDVGTLAVAIDRESGTVKVDVAAKVPMTLTRVAGFDSVDVPVTAQTIASQREIELALVLDVTGSMQGSKIADLRAAAAALVDLMLPDNGAQSKARIALAPYADSVNAGSYFNAATGRKSGTGCVVERSGTAKFKDDAPATGAYVGYDKNAPCPSATIQPLTTDKASLKIQISKLRADGNTAGHIGTAWGWYLVSPQWNSLWPKASKAQPYDANKTIKAVLLMTDGAFNTQYVAANGKSAAQAKSLCTSMKADGVVVYAVAFDAGAQAEALLSDCATSPGHYFTADNGADLQAAFQSVGRSLTDLHLTQ